MINKKAIVILFIQISLILIFVLYLFLRANGAPVYLFWPIFWSIIIVSILGIIKLSEGYKISLLILLEICLSLILIVSAPNIFQMDRDTYFESQYASTIVKQGLWNPTLGVGFAENYYGYNPVLHFILAFSSLTTGLTTYALSKYVYFVLLRLILVLLVFLLISAIIKKEKQRIAYLATFIFIASSGMAFITISRRFIAGVFMLLAIYTILKTKSGSDAKVWNILFYIFSAIVVIGNHTIAYLLLIFLTGVWIFGIAAKTKILKRLFLNEDLDKEYPNVLFKLIYFFIIFFSWEIFVSTFLLNNDISYILRIIKLISDGYGVKLLFMAQGATPATFIYHSYEIFAVYLYQILFLLLGIAGFIFFAINLRLKPHLDITENKGVLLFFGIFSIIMYVLASFLMRTELDMAAYSFLWFFCISLSIFIAYFLDLVYTKTNKHIFLILAILISILFYTGHIFMGIYTPRLTNRALDEDIVIGMDVRSQSPELYYSAVWSNNNIDKNSKIIGDINIFEVYSGMFEFDVSTDEYQQKQIYNGSIFQLNELLESSNVYFGSYEHTVHYDAVDYLIINNRFFNNFNYLFGEPVDPQKSEKFDKTPSMDKIYDNKGITIYRNTHSKNS